MEKKVALVQMRRIIPLIAMALTIGGSALANGLGGQRLEKVVNNQIVDIGTDQTSAPQAGKPIQFDFNLLKSDTRAAIPCTNVDVNVTRNSSTLLDSDLIMEPPLTLAVFTFPDVGDYTLKVTFYNNDTQMATASFQLAIGGAPDRTRWLYGGAIGVGILLGLVGGFWGGRKRKASVIS